MTATRPAVCRIILRFSSAPSSCASRLPSDALGLGGSLSVLPHRAQRTVDYFFESPAGAASDSSAANAAPFGSCLSVLPSHDPTPSSRVFKALQPSSEDMSQALEKHLVRPPELAKVLLFHADGRGVADQPRGLDQSMPRTVSTLVGQVAASYAPRGVRVAERVTLSSVGLPAVYCSSGCEMDLAYVSKLAGVTRVLFVHEYKAPPVLSSRGHWDESSSTRVPPLLVSARSAWMPKTCWCRCW